MAQRNKAKNPIKSTRTAFEIVDSLQELDGARVTELAQHLGKSKGSVHNHLRTLLELGYVTKDGDTYHVGLRFLDHGMYARQRQPLYEIAKTEVDRLAEETGELVNLLVEENGLGIYLYQATGENAVNVDAHVGSHVHLHNTALGKAILAHLPRERVEEIIAHRGLEATTERTITDREVFFDHLEEIRERGVAFDDEERLPGLQCVAVPIRNYQGHAEGALSVSAPTRRMARDPLESEIPSLLKDAANVVQLNVTYR
ncbi:IclR family transcriptional regulator [Halomarina pelagica]|uniref:IclR family transcriptional regulator n=1 Tax=Halomarina pelagica TaxID=2961599 RepID=UPI0020C33DB4|nr:IclR family transcriptional regulator [Halomarina sp. BND7]